MAPPSFRGTGIVWAPLQGWHLLSLDAPTVACVWALLLAHAAGVNLPATDLLILGTGTWLMYVADRLLDTLPGRNFGKLRERHQFHARWRLPLLSASFIATLVIIFLIVFRMRPELRRADAGIFAVALLYFAIVHGGKQAPVIGKAKEAVVALLFAAACAAPAWTSSPRRLGLLAAATVLLSGLCWLNCIAIEHWESTLPQRLPLGSAGIALAAFSGGLACIFDVRAPCVAVAVSALLLLALDHTRLSPQKLRILADVALLTPLLAFLW